MSDQNENVITERVFANDNDHLGASPVWTDLSARDMRRIVGGGIEGTDIGGSGPGGDAPCRRRRFIPFC